MAECHVVHVGRDSRIQAATLRFRKTAETIVFDFTRFDQRFPAVTEFHMTNAQIRALFLELGFQTAGDAWNDVLAACRQAWPNDETMRDRQSPAELITRIIRERDDAHAALARERASSHGVPSFSANVGGGRFEITGPVEGSTPSPSTPPDA